LGAAAFVPAIAAQANDTVRFVRPKRASKYGFGDGSSYDNAWNGLSAMGAAQWAELDVPDKSSTLWVCGTHFERIDFAAYAKEFGGAFFTAAGRQDGLVIRGDYEADPGTIDTRGHTYTYFNRNLGPALAYDQWLAGPNAAAGSNCSSVNFWTACNVTLRNIKIIAGTSPLNCTTANNPAAKRRDLYYPPGNLTHCNESPYDGIAIYYPQNVAIFSNNGSRNLRVSACVIIGDGESNRTAIGLQGGGGKSSIVTIDENDISGFLKGIQMSFGQSNRDLAVSIRNNRIHHLGFAAGHNDFVDGIVCYGDFNNRNQSCEIVGNDVSGFFQDGIDLFYGGGVLVKDNYIHDANLARISYMTAPFWNADEKIGDQNGIKFGGDGSFSGNRIIGNLVMNMLTVGISSNNTGNRSLIANNTVINTNPNFGGDGILVFGIQSIDNIIANNTVVGYKRGITCESARNTIINNICKSARKNPVYINSGRPQADILIAGQGAALGNRTMTNLVVNNLLIKQDGGASVDTANKSGDPFFLDEARHDLRLKPGSPWLGAGTNPGFDLVALIGVPARRQYLIGAIEAKVPPRDVNARHILTAPPAQVEDEKAGAH
jgi:hypothetical protein